MRNFNIIKHTTITRPYRSNTEKINECLEHQYFLGHREARSNDRASYSLVRHVIVEVVEPPVVVHDEDTEVGGWLTNRDAVVLKMGI